MCFLVFFVNFYSVLSIVSEDLLGNSRPRALLLSSGGLLLLQAGNEEEGGSA